MYDPFRRLVLVDEINRNIVAFVSSIVHFMHIKAFYDTDTPAQLDTPL